MTAVLIALCLSAPLQYVEAVYSAAERVNLDPLLACAVVEWESGFYPTGWNVNEDGSTDYGLWRLCSRYHNQYREDIAKHCAQGAAFLMGLVVYRGGNVEQALSMYNTGQWWGEIGARYAERVLAIYDRLKEATK